MGTGDAPDAKSELRRTMRASATTSLSDRDAVDRPSRYDEASRDSIHRGFTVEVLVAMFVMFMAAMAWQGIDGTFERARQVESDSSDVAFADVITQWEQDLGPARHPSGTCSGFDGATVRLTRRVDAGVQLVAWGRAATVMALGVAGTIRAVELQQQWLAISIAGQRNGHWYSTGVARQSTSPRQRLTNAQSSGDAAVPPAAPSASAPSRRQPCRVGTNCACTITTPPPVTSHSARQRHGKLLGVNAARRY
jgi:general secretion pathway protein J